MARSGELGPESQRSVYKELISFKFHEKKNIFHLYYKYTYTFFFFSF